MDVAPQQNSGVRIYQRNVRGLLHGKVLRLMIELPARGAVGGQAVRHRYQLIEDRIVPIAVVVWYVRVQLLAEKVRRIWEVGGPIDDRQLEPTVLERCVVLVVAKL